MNNLLMIVVLSVVTLAALALCYSAWIALPREMRTIYKQSLCAFAHAIEARSNGLYGQAEHVALLAGALAREMHLPHRARHRLEFACYLRDIGLAAIPYRIINSPDSRTEAEEATFQRHAETGAAMLEQMPHLAYLAPIVRYHHAHFDTPQSIPGMKGLQLPVESRILAVVSAFCEWEVAFGSEEALRLVTERAGAEFDPDVTQTLARVMGDVKGGHWWDALQRSVAALF